MSSEVNFHVVPRLFPGCTFRGGRATGSALLRLAIAASLLVVACKSPLSRGDGGTETDAGTSPPASASASAAPPCVPGSVNDCSRCCDRCAAGFCRRGSCAPTPTPYASDVRGEPLTFAGDGFWMDWGAEIRKYPAFGPVIRVRRGEIKLRPLGFGDGRLYGWSEGGQLSSAEDPRGTPVDVGSAGPALDTTLAADGAEVYFYRGGLVKVREGKEMPLGQGPLGAEGRPIDLALGPATIYVAVVGATPPMAGARQEYRSALFSTNRDGGDGRVLAEGHIMNAVATDPRWVYWSDDGSLFCARHGQERRRRFLTLPGAVMMLGTTEEDLFVATRFAGGLDAPPGRHYRIPLPVCAE